MLASVYKAPLRNPSIRPLLRNANTRHFFSTTMASLQVSPRFSKGTDEATALPSLQPLLSSEGGRWTLTSEGEALERSFKFKTFAKTWVR
jgi:4a-hydroxytetrahydrobiopterin dehydratase